MTPEQEFNKIILKHQKLKAKHSDYDYRFNNEKTKSYQIITNKNLIELQPDPYFAKQLCMVNGLTD